MTHSKFTQPWSDTRGPQDFKWNVETVEWNGNECRNEKSIPKRKIGLRGGNLLTIYDAKTLKGSVPDLREPGS